MASADCVFVNKDFFHCSICLEIYEIPRSLPCLHTFCHTCLTGYIKKLLDQSGKQNLFCPICRSNTQTDTTKFDNVEKWVESFPINFTLLSILNDRKTEMDIKKTYCEPCLLEENEVKATVYCCNCSEKLCEECKRHHKKSKALRSHKLVEFGEQESEGSLDVKELEHLSNLTKCPKHNSEEVKYICKDHDQLCCNECAIVSHRKCEAIISLAEESCQGQARVDIPKKLEEIESYTEKVIEHESRYVLVLDSAEKEVKSRLTQFKTDIYRAYNMLEMRILSDMSSRKQKLSDASSLTKESAEKLKVEIKHTAEKMKKTSKLGTGTHVFLLEREMRTLVKQYEQTLSDIYRNTSSIAMSLTEARHGEDVSKAIQEQFQLQEATVKPDLLPLPGKRDFQDRKVTFMKEFGTNVNAQPRYCLWIGSCIIVAFDNFSKINLYNEEDGSCMSYYDCPSAPTNLTELENGEMAISLPQSYKIDIIKLSDNRLSYVRSLDNLKADLIVYNRQQKQLFAFTSSDGIIRKFYQDGKSAGEIRIEETVKDTIGSAYNIAFNKGFTRIYISCHHSSKLLSIDMSGKVVFQYGILYPWACMVDTDDNIYIASSGKNEVHQVDEEGKLIRKIISENIKYPMGMCFSKDADRIVVTCNSLSSTTGGTGVCIKLYQFE